MVKVLSSKQKSYYIHMYQVTENEKLKLHKYSHPFRTNTCTYRDIYLYTDGNRVWSNWCLAHAVQYKLNAADKIIITFSTKLVHN